MEKNKTDYLNIKEWARAQIEANKATIRELIAGGLDKQKAIDIVLEGSTIGTGYKDQMLYELKGEL